MENTPLDSRMQFRMKFRSGVFSSKIPVSTCKVPYHWRFLLKGQMNQNLDIVSFESSVFIEYKLNIF